MVPEGASSAILTSMASAVPRSTTSSLRRGEHPTRPLSSLPAIDLRIKVCSASLQALAKRVYAASGQAGSALHTMTVLQVFQSKLLHDMDESGRDPNVFKELHTATDLALRASEPVANLVVLERHL